MTLQSNIVRRHNYVIAGALLKTQGNAVLSVKLFGSVVNIGQAIVPFRTGIFEWALHYHSLIKKGLVPFSPNLHSRTMEGLRFNDVFCITGS